MWKTYSVADARARLSSILDDVEAGSEVRLTRRGRPVAVVLCPKKYDVLRSGRANFRDLYRAFVAHHAPEEIGLEPSLFALIRDRGAGRRAGG
jgi:prevent-host-death family protein